MKIKIRRKLLVIIPCITINFSNNIEKVKEKKNKIKSKELYTILRIQLLLKTKFYEAATISIDT